MQNNFAPFAIMCVLLAIAVAWMGHQFSDPGLYFAAAYLLALGIFAAGSAMYIRRRFP